MFRIPLDLTDAEFDAYQGIVDRVAARYLSKRSNAALIGMGCGTAFASAGMLYAAGAVSQGGGAVVTALSFGAYWLGVWGPSISSAALDPRDGSRERVRRDLKDAVLLVGMRRLAIAGAGWRSTLARSDIHAVTSEAGLVLIWRSPERDIYPYAAIASRRLTADQQAELAALPPASQDSP